MKKLLILVFPFLFTSCQPIAKLVMGVKQPRYETHESIKAFCLEKGIDTSNLFMAKKNWHAENKSLLFTENDSIQKQFSFMEILAFDSEGRAITLNNPGECKPGAISALESSRFISDSTTKPPHADINTFISYFDSETNSQLSFDDVKDGSDVYIAFFWPKFVPKFTLKNYKELESLVNNDTSSVKYKLLLFNQDYRNWENN